MNSFRMKLVRAIWFAMFKFIGPLHPRTGSRIAVHYYSRAGMNVVGKPTFVASNAWFDGSKSYSLITLHEGCNISKDVKILTHDWSPYCVFKSLGRSSDEPVGRLLPVVVKEHAFIGLGAVLLPGSRVGRGALIGAGAVVRGEVPDYAIVLGNPGVVVGDAREYVRAKFPREWSELPRSQSDN